MLQFCHDVGCHDAIPRHPSLIAFLAVSLIQYIMRCRTNLVVYNKTDGGVPPFDRKAPDRTLPLQITSKLLDIGAQCYVAFYGRNLLIFVIG
jgi:hypothetical protein